MVRSSLTLEPASHGDAQLGLQSLNTLVSKLFRGGIADNTMASYRTGQRRYLIFCRSYNLSPLPLEESTLCRFVAFLASLSLSYSSIQSHLSAARHLQISTGLPDPSHQSHPCLDCVLRGIRRIIPQQARPKRLPITPQILMACPFMVFGQVNQLPTYGQPVA